MKTCQRCGKPKPLDAFYARANGVDGRQSYCKPCQKENEKSHFAANRHLYSVKSIRTNRKQRLKASQVVWDYLLSHPCVDCGERDPVVLTFDHVRGRKVANISSMRSTTTGMPALTAEIAKCEVRCANCHTRRTAQQFGWYRTLERTTEYVTWSETELDRSLFAKEVR